jgi:serine/threonine-protein kinase
MGTVYDVEDTSIGKLYVLKTLHPQLGAREDLARRMQNEARTLARLHHPNIVEIITAGITADELRLPYYVMERLSGQSLRIILQKKGMLEVPHALHIAIDLLDALDHAHDKGVVHRDVKPDNIFLHRTNANVTVTKLLDFGIVSLLDSGPRETAGRFLGTLQYASPEQLRGENPTPQMDIYCAALVLFEMIAGRGPFDEHGDSRQIAGAHLHRTPPPLSSFVPVPRELEKLIAAALAKLPDGRPRDAHSFAASLRNLKRALGPDPNHPSTENRATGLALIEPPQAAPVVEALQPATGPMPAPLQLQQRTTVRGMVAPTMGPALAPDPSLPITATSAEPVDRQAETRSLVVPQPLPGAQGPAGTEGLDLAPGRIVTVRALPLPMADGVVPIQWPPERPAAASEEPQVRSLPGTTPPGTSRAAFAMVASATLGLIVVAGALLLVRQRGVARAPATESPTVTTVASATPPPSSSSAAVPAAPPAAPTLDEPVAASASAAPIPSTPPLRQTAKPRASTAPKPLPTPSPLPDRPGPGF